MKHVLDTHAAVPAAVSSQLDTLRGLSAIAVLVSHSNQIIVAPTNHAMSATFGLLAQSAVMMFFALSGFLICKAITRNVTQHGRFSLPSYAADRFNRIVPPIAFSLLLVLTYWVLAPLVFSSGTRAFLHASAGAARQGFFLDIPSFTGTALFVNEFLTRTVSPNGPLWSLAYEAWYYVAAGLVATFRGRRGAVAALAVLMAFGALNRVFLLFSLVWFAGALVAVAHNTGLRLTGPSRAVGAVCLVAALVLGGMLLNPDKAWWGTRVQAFFSLSIGLFFASALHEIVRGTVAIRPVARGSAAFSYTLYIVHFPTLLMVYGVTEGWVHGNLAASWITATAAAIGCLLLSRWLARFIENWRPVRSAGSRPAART